MDEDINNHQFGGKVNDNKTALNGKQTKSKHARNRTVTGSKISSRTGIYTIGIAHYTYSASLHKFVCPAGLICGDKTLKNYFGGNNYILSDLHTEKV